MKPDLRFGWDREEPSCAIAGLVLAPDFFVSYTKEEYISQYSSHVSNQLAWSNVTLLALT
jgi:hypothetical protein